MTRAVGERVQALPAAAREALWSVPGPGWVVRPSGAVGARNERPDADWRKSLSGWEWWPANPAAALVAVLDYDLRRAHERITDWIDAHGGDDHAAALGLIEASLGGSHGP